MDFINTLLMTPGPVHLDPEIMLAGANPLRHHRTGDFTPFYNEVLRRLKSFIGVSERLFLITSSGTGAMETAIANLFNEGETILNVQTGVFGVRFTKICEAYRLKTIALKCGDGKAVTVEQIEAALKEHPEISGVTVTFNETSTGICNDIEAIGNYLNGKGKYLVVDGVSGLGALPYNHDKWHVDATVGASQKGFLAPPGVSMIALSSRAWQKALTVKCHSLYFDLKAYAKNQDLAVPAFPWTPAINVQYSLLAALKKIDRIGLDNCINHYKRMAEGLRSGLKALGLRLFTEERALSNVLTVFYAPENVNPKDVISEMVQRHGIRIAGGQEQFANSLLRITTIGCIGEREIIATVAALEMTLKKMGAVKQLGIGVSAVMEYFFNN